MHTILDIPRGEYVHIGQVTDSKGTHWWGLWCRRRLCVTASDREELMTYTQDRGLILAGAISTRNELCGS